MRSWHAVCHYVRQKVCRLCGLCNLVIALAFAGLAPSLLSQPVADLFDVSLEQLEQIIVTAQKREQSLQEVPIAIATINGEKIADSAISDLQALSAYLPGVTINQAVIDNNLFIRGIGSGVNLGFERSVGTYVDGVYIGRGQLARTPFLDVQRVEVLKGPQGILFGKNTIAGALNITTASPTDEFEGFVEGYVDPRYGEEQINAVVSGPLSSTLAGRLAVSYRQLEGYFEHLLTDEDVVEREDRLVRGKLRWQPTEALTATLKFERAEFEDEERAQIIRYAGPGSDFGFLVTEDKPVSGSRPGAFQFNDTESDTIALTFEYALGDHTLTAISAYLDYTADIFDDVLTTPYFEVPGDDALFTLATDERFDQLSQEVRIASPEARNISYLAGIYVQRTDLEVIRTIVWPFGGLFGRRSQQDGDSGSLFGQLTWRATERLRFNLGTRYTRESKDFDREQVDLSSLPSSVSGTIDRFRIDRDESKLTWALSTQYDFSDNAMGYVNVSTGFKSGGFDESVTRGLAPGERPEDLFEFEEETVRSIEIGGKLKFADGAAELNVAVFRSEYDDLQTSAFDGIAGFVVANAASSITQGVEADLRWRALPRLFVTGAVTYLDAYFDDFDNGPCSQWHAANTLSCTGNRRDLSDESLVFAPDLSATLGIEYSLALAGGLEAWANLDVIYTDEFFTVSDLDPFTRQDSYTRIDLRLALGPLTGTWEVALVGKNLTDETVSGWLNDLTLSTTPGRQNTYSALLEPPRTVALQGRVRF